jgi:NAD(P)-dependent dehydrogenase (short-subunit alcohol dehydrogenase family)
MKKIIFITGTSTGFGKLMAITLAGEGHTVIAGMRNVTSKNAAVAKELSAHSNIHVAEIDVTNDASVIAAIENSIQEHGRIDVLVNNAAVSGYGLLEAYSLHQIRKMFEVNFYGVVRTYQAVLPYMRKEKSGLIINITSGASGHTLPFMIPYLASKFAVESITEGIQEELSQFGIENVSIQPGVYPTEMNTGAKEGIHSDKPTVTEAYEPVASELFKNLGAGLFGKMAAFNMDPQVIADGVSTLIAMPAGRRPLRYPLDAIAEGTDVEFINARAEIKARWLAKYTS